MHLRSILQYPFYLLLIGFVLLWPSPATGSICSQELSCFDSTTTRPTIECRGWFWGQRYYLNGKRVKPDKIRYALREHDTEAFKTWETSTRALNGQWASYLAAVGSWLTVNKMYNNYSSDSDDTLTMILEIFTGFLLVFGNAFGVFRSLMRRDAVEQYNDK